MRITSAAQLVGARASYHNSPVIFGSLDADCGFTARKISSLHPDC